MYRMGAECKIEQNETDNACCVFTVIKDRPPLPPSRAQAVLVKSLPTNYTYRQSIINLFKNKSFILLVISYGEFIFFKTCMVTSVIRPTGVTASSQSLVLALFSHYCVFELVLQ